MRKLANTQKIIDKVKKSEQIISMVMGVLVVLAIGGLVYRYFQKQEPIRDQIQEQEIQKDGDEITDRVIEVPSSHTVQIGENLWEISEQYYQSGYNWVDIAAENNLNNPNLLAAGQELKIPDVEPKQLTVDGLPETGVEEEITGTEYTVVEGDSLSLIAQRAYGDMFAWPEIWTANRDEIDNPNIIEPGMVLEIPR